MELGEWGGREDLGEIGGGKQIGIYRVEKKCNKEDTCIHVMYV